MGRVRRGDDGGVSPLADSPDDDPAKSISNLKNSLLDITHHLKNSTIPVHLMDNLYLMILYPDCQREPSGSKGRSHMLPFVMHHHIYLFLI